MLLSDRVLFLDGEALVIDKPAGLPVDAPRDGSISLENHLDLLKFGFKRWPLPVHRLDRDTSGCLLLARNPKAHGRFTRAFESREVEKQYLAIVDGVPDGDGGTIDIALAKVSTAETGRTHQLRVHALEGLGFPLVGDPVYGRGGTKTRTLLHAERLIVKRDVKPSIIAEAPFPDSFIALGFAAPEGAEPTRG